jgi:ATP-dependent DNA helicase RecG
MTLVEIKRIIENESIEMEFKTNSGEIKSACRTLCAFLNYRGGYVFIGVKDDTRLVGQMVTDSTRLDIANELEKFEPPVRVIVDYVPFTHDKQIICLHVEEGPYMPYVYDGKPYERYESSTRKMSQPRYNQLLSRQNQLNHSWERFNAEKYTIEDLDHNLILNIIHASVKEKRLVEIAMREDIPTVLEKLELIEDGHVKNAAVALFGKKFLPNYPQCQLQMARFKGLDRHEFLDSEQLHGNIFEFLDRAMLFVNRHLPVAAKIVSGQLERVETPLIPLDSIREALINACCHREYSVYGGSIKLAIYDDRMELINNGGLLPGVTLEKIKDGLSERRNPLIGNILFRCRLIEGWGRGIREIIKECLDAGDPEPQFDCDEYYFQVTFKFPTSMKPEVILIDEQDKPFKRLTERQKEIVKIIEQLGGAKTSEIKEKLSDRIPDRTLRFDLAALKKLGIITSRGRGSSAEWLKS